MISMTDSKWSQQKEKHIASKNKSRQPRKKTPRVEKNI